MSWTASASWGGTWGSPAGARGFAKRDVELLVLHDEEGLGVRGARINTSSGYARNVLVKERKCVYATRENVVALEAAMAHEKAERTWRRRYDGKPWVLRRSAVENLRRQPRSIRVRAWKASRWQYRDLVKEASESGVPMNPASIRAISKRARPALRVARKFARAVYGDPNSTEEAKKVVRDAFFNVQSLAASDRASVHTAKAMKLKLSLAQQWADILRRELVTNPGRVRRTKKVATVEDTDGWWKAASSKKVSGDAEDEEEEDYEDEDEGEDEDGDEDEEDEKEDDEDEDEDKESTSRSGARAVRSRTPNAVKRIGWRAKVAKRKTS